jgi:hypothetical protein
MRWSLRNPRHELRKLGIEILVGGTHAGITHLAGSLSSEHITKGYDHDRCHAGILAGGYDANFHVAQTLRPHCKIIKRLQAKVIEIDLLQQLHDQHRLGPKPLASDRIDPLLNWGCHRRSATPLRTRPCPTPPVLPPATRKMSGSDQLNTNQKLTISRYAQYSRSVYPFGVTGYDRKSEDRS